MNATPTNDLRHLFDGTHCLSKRQLRDYAASTMSREEAYAVESHLNTCPLCSTAVDGMLAHFPESADVLATVDAGFLKDHFKKHSPQIHLNTVAPAATAPVTRRIPGTGGARVIDLSMLRTVGIAAAAVLLIGSLWWFQSRRNDGEQLGGSSPVAQAEPRVGAQTSDAVVPSSIPESERRLAQAAPQATPPAGQTQALAESEKKKSTNELLAEADAAVADDNSRSGPAVPAAKPASTAPAPLKSEGVVSNAAAQTPSYNFSTQQKFEDVNVRSRRYERPLIEPKQPGSRTVLTDKEIEKMPTRNPMDAASTAPGVYQNRSGSGLNIGGGRSDKSVVIVDGVQQAPDGKALYKKGEYAAALKVFKQQITSTSGSAREEATLYAARCHRALGQDAAAEKLLQTLADGSGSRARAARRELRDMDREEEPRASRRAKADKPQ